MGVKPLHTTCGAELFIRSKTCEVLKDIKQKKLCLDKAKYYENCCI